MARALEFHPEARDEFFAAAARYAAIRPSLGAAFQEHVEAATDRAVRSPATGARVGAELRRVFVRRFPYFVLYSADDAQIFVVAVAHFRQRPGYWRQRR